MKRILSVLLITLFLFTGCGTQGDVEEPSTDPAPAVNEAAWEEARRLLPTNPAQSRVVPSVAVEDPVAMCAAEFLSGALVVYPEHPLELGPDSPPSQLFLLHTGLLGTDGTQFGEVGTEGDLFRQVDKLLGHPGGFITREQVEASVRRYYPDVTLQHQTVPTGDGEAFGYREDLNIYLYPRGEVRYYEPVLLNYVEDSEGRCWSEVAFVRPAREAGEAYFDWSGELIGAWEVEESVLENPDRYPRAEVELQRTEEGFALIRVKMEQQEQEHAAEDQPS